MLLKILAAAVSASVLMGGITPLCAQSLADVARKEEERRKAIKDNGKVYTNKDLGSVPATTPAPPPDSSRTAAPPDASKDERDEKPATGQGGKSAVEDKEKGPAKDQAYWSGRMKQLQAALDRDQTYADAMQSRVNALTADFVNRDDPAQRAVIVTDRQKAATELDRLKQAVQAHKKAIADLEDDARRAGVPPGWLR
jgi:hypothetical protein